MRSLESALLSPKKKHNTHTLTTVRARKLPSADRRHASSPTSRKAVAREAYRWAASAFMV
jgi:hypothetical protein